MSTWIVRFDPPVRPSPAGRPVRVGIKDLIDLSGVPTTAACRAVAEAAVPATSDARCLAGLRAAEAAGAAVIVGKTNLHELALGVTGVNRWTGTPVNPLDARRVPGGSSSGSAVAVAAGEADVALGSDSGGSVRIPAACCGVAGLKTTARRVPVEGVWPLAPSLDTIGPLAADVAGLVAGMTLLEPGFAVAAGVPERVARLRLPARADIDAGIDAALRAAEVEMSDVELPGWAAAGEATLTVLGSEAWNTNRDLLPTGLVGADVAARLRSGGEVTAEELDAAAAVAARWQRDLARLFGRYDVLALPTLLDVPPLLEHAEDMLHLRATLPVNLAGLPALAMPVAAATFPASLQLVGPPGSEERLLALGQRIESAGASAR